MLDSDVVNRSVSKVEQTITRHDSTLGIQRLEHDKLVLRELHIGPHLFVELVKRAGPIHPVNPVESFDSGKCDSELINHKTQIVIQKYKKSPCVAK